MLSTDWLKRAVMKKALVLLLLAITACSRTEPPTASSDSTTATPEVSPSISTTVTPTATQSPFEPGAEPASSPTARSTTTTSTQKATLTTKDPGSPINVREGASTTTKAQYTAKAGDPVLVLKNTQGDDGQVWYQVKFEKSGVVGWIRGDFVALSDSSTTPPSPAPTVEATSSP